MAQRAYIAHTLATQFLGYSLEYCSPHILGWRDRDLDLETITPESYDEFVSDTNYFFFSLDPFLVFAPYPRSNRMHFDPLCCDESSKLVANEIKKRVAHLSVCFAQDEGNWVQAYGESCIFQSDKFPTLKEALVGVALFLCLDDEYDGLLRFVKSADSLRSWYPEVDFIKAQIFSNPLWETAWLAVDRNIVRTGSKAPVVDERLEWWKCISANIWDHSATQIDDGKWELSCKGVVMHQGQKFKMTATGHPNNPGSFTGHVEIENAWYNRK